MFAFVALFLITFCSVAARSYQQLNVVNYRWLSIVPTSYLMQSKEYVIVLLGAVWAVNGDYQSLAIGFAVSGTAAWLGCWAGMFIHPKRKKL